MLHTLAIGMPGPFEWMIIAGLGLLIFGKRLPEVGRSLGKGFRKGLQTERDPEIPIPACVVAGSDVVNRFAEKVDGVPWVGLNDLLDIPNTAHILGGCPMGGDANSGVVDIDHQVFNYPGLYVADGSVMPGPVGPNPSLTIAALSDRFATRLLETASSEAWPE